MYPGRREQHQNEKRRFTKMRRLTPQTVNILFFILLIAGTIIAFWGALGDRIAAAVIGVIVMFSSVVLRFIFYRCPHCGKYLDRSTGSFCPHCGQKLDS